MSLDPPIRPDGRCAQCQGRRGRISKGIKGKAARNLAAALALDPFCSAPCARTWHRVDLGPEQPDTHAAADAPFMFDERSTP